MENRTESENAIVGLVVEMGRMSLLEQTAAAEDYTDEKTGLLMCGRCHTPRQCNVEVAGVPKFKAACACKCRGAEWARKTEETERRSFLANIEAEGVTDRGYFTNTFERDNGSRPKTADICRQYVADWDRHDRDGTGILFCGDKGTGKTFFACCIANALLAARIRACVVNLPDVILRAQMGSTSPAEHIDRIVAHRLIVIDDFGAQSGSDFRMEVTYSLIDRIVQSGRALIVTTNTTPEAMREAGDMRQARINDRVLGACQTIIRMPGASLRGARGRE